MYRIIEKNRVGFGRTEGSIPPLKLFVEIYKMGMVSEATKNKRKTKQTLGNNRLDAPGVPTTRGINQK